MISLRLYSLATKGLIDTFIILISFHGDSFSTSSFNIWNNNNNNNNNNNLSSHALIYQALFGLYGGCKFPYAFNGRFSLVINLKGHLHTFIPRCIFYALLEWGINNPIHPAPFVYITWQFPWQHNMAVLSQWSWCSRWETGFIFL